MMLEWLGHKAAHDAILAACEKSTASAVRTPDLGVPHPRPTSADLLPNRYNQHCNSVPHQRTLLAKLRQ